MNPDKIFGYMLLFLGLSIILFSVFSAFSTFTGLKKVPELFRLEKTSQSISMGGMDIEGLEIIDPKYLSLTGNLMAQFLFVWLLISAGGRIASIGVSMIKKPS